MISTVSRPAAPALARSCASSALIHGGCGRDVDRQVQGGRPGQFGDGEFEDAGVDQPDEAKLFRQRHDGRGRQQRTVGPADAQQALIGRDAAVRPRRDDRLEGQADAPVVERGDDLVGDPEVLPALPVALEVRHIGLEGAAAARLHPVQRFLCAAHHGGERGGVARRDDTAHGDADRDRARRSHEHVVANDRQDAVGGDGHVLRLAIAHQEAELVAGEPAQQIAATHARADAPADRGDDRIGDVEAVGIVDMGEIVDGRDDEADGAAHLMGVVQRLFQHLAEAMTRQLAGQRVDLARLDQATAGLVAVGDDAHRAMGVQGAAVGGREPAAGILDPVDDAGLRGNRIFDFVGDAVAAIDLRRVDHRLVTAGGGLGSQQLRIGAAGAEAGEILDAEQGRRVRAPGQAIRGHRPFIGCRTDGRENGVCRAVRRWRRVRCRCVACQCHAAAQCHCRPDHGGHQTAKR